MHVYFVPLRPPGVFLPWPFEQCNQQPSLLSTVQLAHSTLRGLRDRQSVPNLEYVNEHLRRITVNLIRSIKTMLLRDTAIRTNSRSSYKLASFNKLIVLVLRDKIECCYWLLIDIHCTVHAKPEYVTSRRLPVKVGELLTMSILQTFQKWIKDDVKLVKRSSTEN